ncbi:MAG: ABC transporter substrate-binding protein [Candidatus Pristimantibacillus lignocellulolyticus]|uniref:ABC transporter substrate-binding protein n=1 Tax=Candidatus Pristimantibacillus lignocellulolyticus TaxID=2994561 RepID=A0A9J6ZKA4_9BACL|nr:MAG: ABC transporter substrate-binding protein [Candidatus Pristimantibacillus lignocellulolyticus]
MSSNITWYRKLGILLIVTMLAIIMVACGSKNSNQSTEGNSNQQGISDVVIDETTNDKEQDFKIITTVNGEIKVPAHPKRIVAEEYLGSLIALDVIPVGAPGLTLDNMYFKEALTGVADTGAYGQMSSEKILELQPDLIISGIAENYEVLSKIAPTITIPYGDLKNAHEELTYFGELLGMEQEAKDWLVNYDQIIAEAKQKVDEVIPADASFSIIENTAGSTYAYGDNFGRGGQAVYQALGRKPPAEVADHIMEKQWAEISEETLTQYAGDYIILTSNDRTLEDYKADPIWSSLPAIKNNQVFVWKEEVSWYYDPIAILKQTEQLTAWLTGLHEENNK